MKNLLVIILILILVPTLFSQKKSEPVLNPNGVPNNTRLNCNNISTWFYNNGSSDIDPGGNSGFKFPKGTSHSAVFQSGLLWGAKIAGHTLPRVGGSVYRSGLQPGKILSVGVAESPDLDKNRIYRVRSDVFPGSSNPDLSAEITDGEGNYNTIKAQYEKDWNEWPAADGAPFVDKNSNGTYEPNLDFPGVDGADQTIWFVANDLDPAKTQLMYGTNPLGIELQVTIWGYNHSLLSNVLFRKYKLINKSNTTFDSMYLSMWSDPDVGSSHDDYAGCDTTLNLGFAYNGSDKDADYGYQPPAVGFDMLNLPMTAFYFFASPGSPLTFDPTQGDSAGARQYYNNMQGKVGLTGEYYIDC